MHTVFVGLLEIIAIVLVIVWIGGLSFHIAGSLIHLLLVVAVILFIYRYFFRGTVS